MTDIQLVRYKDGKSTFEIVCKRGKPLEYRKGNIGIDNVVEAMNVFTDFKSGDQAGDSELISTFQTSDIPTIVKRILDDGEIQLTTEERRQFVEQKRNDIVNYIHKYFVDPRRKLPHPISRIENALDELKIRIDPSISTKRLIKDIVNKIPDVLPLRKMEVEANIKIPHKYIGQAYGVFKEGVTINREKYDTEGCNLNVSIIPGDVDYVVKQLNSICQDDYEFVIPGAQEVDEEEGKGGKQGRKGKKGRKGGRRR